MGTVPLTQQDIGCALPWHVATHCVEPGTQYTCICSVKPWTAAALPCPMNAELQQFVQPQASHLHQLAAARLEA